MPISHQPKIPTLNQLHANITPTKKSLPSTNYMPISHQPKMSPDIVKYSGKQNCPQLRTTGLEEQLLFQGKGSPVLE
jgi:hypothetical protein